MNTTIITSYYLPCFGFNNNFFVAFHLNAHFMNMHVKSVYTLRSMLFHLLYKCIQATNQDPPRSHLLSGMLHSRLSELRLELIENYAKTLGVIHYLFIPCIYPIYPQIQQNYSVAGDDNLLLLTQSHQCFLSSHNPDPSRLEGNFICCTIIWITKLKKSFDMCVFCQC